MSKDICYYHYTPHYKSVIYNDGSYATIVDKVEKDDTAINKVVLNDNSINDSTKFICVKTDTSGIFHINKKCLINTKKVSKTEYNYTFVAPEPKYDKNGNCISGEYTPRAILKIATKGVKLVIPDNDNTATSYELAIHN